MDAGTIDRVMKAIHGHADARGAGITKDSNGIGLGNVINRLRLYYDKEDVFEIHSAGRYQGTRVTIRIPKQAGLMTAYPTEIRHGVPADAVHAQGV